MTRNEELSAGRHNTLSRMASKGGVCCFVLLIPTPKVYRVPRVSPGVAAPKLFPPTSVVGYPIRQFSFPSFIETEQNESNCSRLIQTVTVPRFFTATPAGAPEAARQTQSPPWGRPPFALAPWHTTHEHSLPVHARTFPIFCGLLMTFCSEREIL